MASVFGTLQEWLGFNSKQNSMRRKAYRNNRCRSLKRRPQLEELESRELMSTGGGFANAGIMGEYFNNTNLTGTAAFTRSDVRVDFDWGTTQTPGGSASAGFKDVSHNNFSVRWTGQVVPAFSADLHLPDHDG